MNNFTSTNFFVTLFGFLSSLDFNNRIENLTLMTKFRGAPYFQRRPLGGGVPEAVPLLPPSRAGPDWNTVHRLVESLNVYINYY